MDARPVLALERQAVKVLGPLTEDAAIAARAAASKWIEELGLGSLPKSAEIPLTPRRSASDDIYDAIQNSRSPFNRQSSRPSDRISEELQGLIDRSTRGDASVAEVGMSDGKAIAAGQDTCHIFTRGLGGCYATAVDVQSASGSRQLVLTHYPIVSEGTQNLRKLMDLIPNDETSRTFTTIFAPETHDVFSATHNAFVRNVGMITRSDAPLSVKPYPMLGDFAAKDYGSIRLSLPRNVNEPIRFKTWFSEGSLE